MSETAPQTGSSRQTILLLAMAKRVGTAVLPFAVVILVWQFASLFFPRFLFPSLIDVFWRCLEIFSDGSMFADVLATVLRIMAGLAGAFVVGGLLALLMVRSRAVDNFCRRSCRCSRVFPHCPGWCSRSSGFMASSFASFSSW
jgi:NitT/TauT family transport system permease protein